VTPRRDGTRFESRRADWLGVAEARARILERWWSLESERVPLARADGRVLTEDLRASVTMPPWDNSAMDGYAVRADDVADAGRDRPIALTVVGSILAGDPSRPTVAAGEAVRIMTGAPVPPGADAVIRVEDTDAEEAPGLVKVFEPVEHGRSVRMAGEDFRAGATVATTGTEVTPGFVALGATLGLRDLHVRRRPTVALLATGDELRPPDRYEDVLRGTAIPESNTPMLSAMVREAGGVVAHAALARDEEEDLARKLADADGVDVLVTIGGASMGEADLVKRVLDRAGFRQDFWRVRMRPGSPFSFGVLPRGDRLQPVFGLPGNPASAFVTFELFVRPFLRRLGGHGAHLRPSIRCVAGEELRGPTDLATYLRVQGARDTARSEVRLTGPQGSGLVLALARADGLAILPEGVGSVPAGAQVDVMLLTGNATEADT
jgi:molybdopterin molybdotransferase